MTESPPDLSIVIPVLNEADNVAELAAEVRAALASICRFEILFVDDGSTDATAAVLRDLAAASPSDGKIRLLRHGASPDTSLLFE